MKKLPIAFFAFFALSLCSFVIYESYQENPPIEESPRKAYLSLFRSEKLPYRIDENNNTWANAPRLTRDHRHFIPDLARGGFSRMGPSTYRPDAMIVSNDKFDAVIYIKKEPYGSAVPYFTLQTIDKKGEVLASQIIYDGYYKENEDKADDVFTIINADLSINIHKIAFDYQSKTNIILSQTWTITENGKIEQTLPEKAIPKKIVKNS